jgi:hypothetical protein
VFVFISCFLPFLAQKNFLENRNPELFLDCPPCSYSLQIPRRANAKPKNKNPMLAKDRIAKITVRV